MYYCIVNDQNSKIHIKFNLKYYFSIFEKFHILSLFRYEMNKKVPTDTWFLSFSSTSFSPIHFYPHYDTLTFEIPLLRNTHKKTYTIDHLEKSVQTQVNFLLQSHRIFQTKTIPSISYRQKCHNSLLSCTFFSLSPTRVRFSRL